MLLCFAKLLNSFWLSLVILMARMDMRSSVIH